jgi:hypothetical protein
MRRTFGKRKKQTLNAKAERCEGAKGLKTIFNAAGAAIVVERGRGGFSLRSLRLIRRRDDLVADWRVAALCSNPTE